jgi:hypothetical protein
VEISSVIYATALRGYVLIFNIVSFDPGTTHNLERTVESATFFDPETAKEVAGPKSRPFVTGAALPGITFAPRQRIATLSPGAIAENAYANHDLGVSFAFPKGWHAVNEAEAAQTQDAESGHDALWGNDAVARMERENAEECGRVLVYATKPPGDTPDKPKRPAIVLSVVADEYVPGVPHFPASTADAEGARHLGSALLRSLQEGPFRPAETDALKMMAVEDHLLIVVAGSLSAKPLGQDLAVRSPAAMVFLEAEGYLVAITFTSPTEAGLRELMREVRIAFTPSGAPRAPSH